LRSSQNATKGPRLILRRRNWKKIPGEY
jgi:hypothetical protein